MHRGLNFLYERGGFSNISAGIGLSGGGKALEPLPDIAPKMAAICGRQSSEVLARVA